VWTAIALLLIAQGALLFSVSYKDGAPLALDKRIAQIRLGLTGQIPDGLLFRISSIDADTASAYAMQQKFVADMMASVPPAARKQLSGLTAVPGKSG